MTRIFNFAILFFLAGIFYIQTDGFGMNSISAKAERVAQSVEPKVETIEQDSVVLASAVVETPKTPIKVGNINALTQSEKEAVEARFVAQRLASSAVIRTAKMTKSTLENAAAPSKNAWSLWATL
jgi:hypothetical protein